MRFQFGDVVLVADGFEEYSAAYLQRMPDNHIAVVSADDLGPIVSVVAAERVRRAPADVVRAERLNSRDRAILRRQWVAMRALVREAFVES